MDYVKSAQTAKRLCDKNGRAVTLYKLSDASADPQKPWRGAGVATKTDPVLTVGVFAVPNTSIPTQSRGLAFDWVDQELLARVHEVMIVPAFGLPDLEEYKVATDGTNELKIVWGQCLKPGDTRILYVFGISR